MVLEAPFHCPECEDYDKEHHTPKLHRAALHWTTHCVNQHDAATQILARAYTTLQELGDLDDLFDGEIAELVDAIHDWLEDEPAGPIPDATPLDDEQATLAELLDIPEDQHVGTCRCGGEVWYSPRDDVSWCTNGCPGGPDIIDREALP